MKATSSILDPTYIIKPSTVASMEDTPPPPEAQRKTYNLTANSISFTKSSTTAGSITPPFLYKHCTELASPPLYILKDVSLTAYPSQILAIVGPSGAGKSRLLDILAARTLPTSGTILLNSSPINPSSYRKFTAHVPQHDACLPLLTVLETFAFSARLLHSKQSETNNLVSSLLAELRLTHLANTRLGDGLSGGERRRVSIGLSLIHDPGILLLDEPTSGLDSSSAYNVMQTLKSIAEVQHRTVVLSIHQPSFKILSTIDNILLLSKGEVVHHGTLCSLEEYLSSNGFDVVPTQLNALEYSMEILPQLQEISSKHIKKINPTPPVPDHEEKVHDHGTTTTTNDDGATNRQYKRSSRAREILTLYARFWKIIYRTKQLLLTNSIEALGVGLVLGTIYINIGFDKQSIQKRLGLFAFTVTFLLSSTTETLPIFINERPILLREASSGIYRISSYLIANTLVFIPYLFAIAILYSISVYFLVGLCATWQAFSYFVLVIWIVVLMANSFVLFLSSLAPNYISGTSLVTVLLGGFFLFSGYFISKQSMPEYWLFMHFFSMYKYAIDALMINEYSCFVDKCLVWYGDGEDHKMMRNTCMVTGRDVLQQRGLHEGQRWINVYALIGFFVFYRLLCLFVLIRRASTFRT